MVYPSIRTSGAVEFCRKLGIIEALAGLSPVMQAFLATMFTWWMTAAGAALMFGASANRVRNERGS
jgi:hypothetical protein